jgi:AraC-like DNA-binding protein
MDVLLVFGARPTLPRGATGADALVVGTQLLPLEVRQRGSLDLLGIRFRPGALPAFVPVCAHEVLDRGVPLADVAPRGWEDVYERLAARSGPARTELLDRLLLERLRRVVPDRFVARAVALLTSSGAPNGAGAGAARRGMGRRTLERRFRDAVGVGPGTLRRILRFRAAVESLTAGHDALSWIARAHGYADQPHFTREVRELSGRTPAELRREARSRGGAG